MNKKYIIITSVTILVITLSLSLIFFIDNRNSRNSNFGNDNNLIIDQSINSEGSLEFVDNTYLPDDYSQYEVGAVPSTEIKTKLELDKKTLSTYYVYSKLNGIIFTYEQESVNDRKPIYVRVINNKVYLSLSEDNIQSGQSIEIINVNEDLRSNNVPTIIREQILIADQKQNCMIEEKDGRYSIISRDKTVKDSTVSCGNYAKGNNRFFIRPQESGTAVNKLIFVSAGDKELSYDGSGNGKYWYESIIVE